jgi:hypothetical protein
MSEPFLDRLIAAANDAAKAEAQFRREAAERIGAFEQERAFAFRRLNLVRAVSDAVCRCENEEKAAEAGCEVLCEKLGWSSASETAAAVLDRFAPVARAVHTGESPEAALTEFESWYAATYAIPFWTLFEQPMAETPRVDF